MTVEAKIGLFRDRVIAGTRECEVHHGRGGWRQIVDPRGGAGRVRYDAWRDRIVVDSPNGSLEIRFRWRNTTFPWRGRVYRIGSMLGNRVTISQADRAVVEGKITWTGVRFHTISPEFRDIERELAMGLGLRAQAIATAVVLVH